MHSANRKDYSRSSLSTPSSRDSNFLPPNGMQMIPLPTGIPVHRMQTIPGIPVQPTTDSAHGTISNLQAMARRLNCVIPEYNVERVGGQDHAPVFRAVCSWNNSRITTEATGSSKNEARRKAALLMIALLQAQGIFLNGIPLHTSNPYGRDRKPNIKYSNSNRPPFFREHNPGRRQDPSAKPETFPIRNSELQSQRCNPGHGLEPAASSFAPSHGLVDNYSRPYQSNQRGGRHYNHHSDGRLSGSHHPGNDHPSSQYPSNNQPAAYHSNSNHPNSGGSQEMRHPRLPEYGFNSSAGTSDNRLNEIPIPRTKQEPRPAFSGHPHPSQQHHQMTDGPPHHRGREEPSPPSQSVPRHRPYTRHVVHPSRLDANPSTNKQSSVKGLDGGVIVASGHRSSSNSQSRNSMTKASDEAAVSAKATLTEPVSNKPSIPRVPLSAPAPVKKDATPPAAPAPKRDPRLALRGRPKDGVLAEGAKAVAQPSMTLTPALEETDLSSGNAVDNSYRPRRKKVKIDDPSSAAEKKNESIKAADNSPTKDSVEKEEVATKKSTPVVTETKKLVKSTAPEEDEGALKKSKCIDAAVKESNSDNRLRHATGSGNPSPSELVEQTKIQVPLRKRDLARFCATIQTDEGKTEAAENTMLTERVVRQIVGPKKKKRKRTADEMQLDVQEGGNEMQSEVKRKNRSPDDDNEAVEDGEIKMDGNAPSPVTISMPPKIPPSAVSGGRRNHMKTSSLLFGTSEALQLGDSRLIVPAKKRPRAHLFAPTRVILWVFCDSREEQVTNLLRAMTFGLYSEIELYIYLFGDAESNLRNSDKIQAFTVPVPGSEGKSTVDLQVAMAFEAGRYSLMLDKLREECATGRGTVADLTLSRVVILSSQPGFSALANANTDVVKTRDLRMYVDDVHRRFCDVNGGDVCVSVNTGRD